jgi:hypothetical protein
VIHLSTGDSGVEPKKMPKLEGISVVVAKPSPTGVHVPIWSFFITQPLKENHGTNTESLDESRILLAAKTDRFTKHHLTKHQNINKKDKEGITTSIQFSQYTA